MSEHQKETAFLKQLISYESTTECRELDERMRQVERDELCVRRAVWVMALSAALAAAGVCYAAIFLSTHSMNLTQVMTQWLVRIFSAIALGSAVCGVAFFGLAFSYRRALNQRRQECRRLALDFIESRFQNDTSRRRSDRAAACRSEEPLEPDNRGTVAAV